MPKYFYLIGWLALTLFLHSGLVAQEGIETRITKIESSLSPRLHIEGRAIPRWTITERMQHFKVPGVSIALIDNGKIAWTKTYGHLAIDSLRSVNEQTQFQAASISKPVAATGI
ncbi:MAG: serine hydrolase domain-containing protein, partial [Bacteroidota bacterium]